MRPGQTRSLAPLQLWGPFVFWALLIFAFSSYPKAIIPQSKYFSWDKLAHIVEFGILGYLTARAFYYCGHRWLMAHYVGLTLIFGLIYAVSDELHQLYVKGRYASAYDVIADVFGVILGRLVFAMILRRRR
jgi:VanZ family protein